jgi:hypothetical protein
VVECDGGGGPLGHPKIFINTDKPQICVCTYCGLPFVSTSCTSRVKAAPRVFSFSQYSTIALSKLKVWKEANLSYRPTSTTGGTWKHFLKMRWLIPLLHEVMLQKFLNHSELRMKHWGKDKLVVYLGSWDVDIVNMKVQDDQNYSLCLTVSGKKISALVRSQGRKRLGLILI